MITVEEALNLILNSVQASERTATVKLEHALGCRLAKNISACMDLPSFDQSNVDGYALADLNQKSWKIIAEIKAGDDSGLVLKAGEAVRIFTGALVPQGSSAVAMQEFVTVNQDEISLDAAYTLKAGEHIRLKGAQIREGSLALEQGLVLQAAALSFIAMLGLDEVPVFLKPRISLILTGNELQPAGSVPERGKIFESNGIALKSALKSIALEVENTSLVKDEKAAVYDAVKTALAQSDLVLISGGISVGDYDFVNEVLAELHTETVFYKIAQKPGKPLYFGKNKNTYVFGLPGNPASALTCFYEYVFPVLNLMQGKTQDLFLPKIHLPILKNYSKKSSLAHFLKAKIHPNGVEPLEGQESFVMKSFAEADAFIYLNKECKQLESGTSVEVHLLPKN